MSSAGLGMGALPWFICGVLALLAGAALADRVRLTRRLARLHDRSETLGDDVWEMRAAVEARRRAEAASEAKSRFLATVSHEVRTPLNGILGIAELLAGTPIDSEQRAYVEAVRTSGRALATLIDEILDFSRIEAGKLDLGSEAFELGGVVEGVVELLAPRAQDKGLEIAAFLDPALPATVTGDPVRLRQVLTNLAGNAVKFTDRGGVGVSVSAASSGAVRFAVADTGPGVPPDRRTIIFEEFEQADGSARRRHGGTGLGLAISKRIVDGMGGTLTLEARPGGGSIFAFEVPLPPAAADAGADRKRWPDLGGRRALVVASSPFQAPFLAETLDAAGATVECATGVETALPRLRGPSPPHLLFVDCALGERAIDALAKAARDAGVGSAFLLFSPFERRAFGQNLAPGFHGWLVKPIRAGSLAERLEPSVGTTARGATARPASRRAVGRAFRVLLAEDNDINALVAVNFLGRLGAQVVHAAEGSSALELALAAMRGDSPSFALILVDISMPDLDGLEVTRRLRRAEATEGYPRVKVVAMTAHAFAENRAACLASGMDDVLTKPVDLSRLAAIVAPPTALKTAG